MNLRKCILSSIILAAPVYSWAHGYISSPESRVYSCNKNQNTACGAAQYEPQSVEAPSGFPITGPADGSLAGAGRFSALDEQTATRWVKHPMSAGKQNFTWYHTAPHRTNNWRYYITKQDWSVNQPLTRAAFESTPFCQVEGNGNTPAATVTHSCVVPARTGYQVIYGVWEIADTSNSFYQVIDVDFGGGNSGGDEVIVDRWSKPIGQIKPTQDLHAGDKVIARLFNNTTELTAQRISMTIASTQQGKANNWSYALAEQINKTNAQLQAGSKDASGKITPAYGINTIYTTANSDLSRVEIEIEQQAPVENNSFALSAITQDYNPATKSLNLNYSLDVRGSLDLEMTVYGADNLQKGQLAASVTNAYRTFTMQMQNIEPGIYTLVVVGKDLQGDVTQQSQTFTVQGSDNGDDDGAIPDNGGEAHGKYDYVFPQSLKKYKAGTLVFQPRTHKIYKCKPAPFAGYCVQWSKTATAYEPGYGFAWKEAWIEMK